MKYTRIVAVMLLVISGAVYWGVSRKISQAPVAVATSSVSQASATATSGEQKLLATSSALESHPEMKLYRNDEYGFEFWYPAGWKWKENIFGNPFSKFNITLMSVNGDQTYQDMFINIVTPEFAANAVAGRNALDPEPTQIVVGGSDGTKYTSLHEMPPEVTIDVPQTDYHFLFCADPSDEDKLNIVISTLRFLKLN